MEDSKRIREQSLQLMVPLFSGFGLLWAIFYYYHGAILAAIIPGSYAVVSFTSLLVFKWRQNFAFFCSTQLFLILVLPLLLHITLGNFISSSGVLVWSTLCPLCALAFQNSKVAGYWLLAFLLLVTSVLFFEFRIYPTVHYFPENLTTFLFYLNISAVTCLVFFLLRFFVNQNEKVKIKLEEGRLLLAAEREKTEVLLLNILPAAIARRLKDGEATIADQRDNTVILFADIVGFTRLTQQSSPETLVTNLNKIVSCFDSLVESMKLEKIKTIGDAYLVAGGLNQQQKDDTLKMAELALAMRSAIHQFSLDNQTFCEIRIGIDMGTVIAGVIGTKKLLYDVWGDTVNTASRMQSTGDAGMIQITETFYQHIKNEFECDFRGETAIKGKGVMNIYHLKQKKQQADGMTEGSAS